MSTEAVAWTRGLRLRGDRAAKLCLWVLAEGADLKTGETWPSYQTICGDAECDRSTAIRKVAKLVTLGLVAIVEQDFRSSNLYRVNVGAEPDWSAWDEKGAASENRGGTVPPLDAPDGGDPHPQNPTGGVADNPTGGVASPATQNRKGTVKEPTTEPEDGTAPPSGTVPTAAAKPDKPVSVDSGDPPGRWEGTGAVVEEIPLGQTSDPVFRIRESVAAEYQADFRALDVRAELAAIRRWNEENPRKRKTRSGIRKHVTAWLREALNNPRRRAAPRAGAGKSSADPPEKPRCTCVTPVPVSQAWLLARGRLAAALPPDDAAAWGAALRLIRANEEEAVLWPAPNPFFKARIEGQFRRQVLQAVYEGYSEARLRPDAQLTVRVAAPCAAHPGGREEQRQGVA